VSIYSILFSADVQKAYADKYAEKMNQTLSEIDKEKAVSVQATKKETQTVKETTRSLGWIAIMVLVGIFTFTILLDLSRLRIKRKVKKIMKKRKVLIDNKHEQEEMKENHFEVYAKVREMDHNLQIKLNNLSKKH
jgi:hypothetical protein